MPLVNDLASDEIVSKQRRKQRDGTTATIDDDEDSTPKTRLVVDTRTEDLRNFGPVYKKPKSYDDGLLV